MTLSSWQGPQQHQAPGQNSAEQPASGQDGPLPGRGEPAAGQTRQITADQTLPVYGQNRLVSGQYGPSPFSQGPFLYSQAPLYGQATPYSPPVYGQPGYSHGQQPPPGPGGMPGYSPAGMPPYGYGAMAAYGQHYLRASAADRERALDLLKAGFAEGRLTQDEHAQRAGGVHAARTYADLTALTADLPGGQFAFGGYPVTPPPVIPAGAYPERTNSLAVTALCCGIGQVFMFGATSILAVIFGHIALSQIRRSGDRGREMAVTGLVLGYTGLTVISLLVFLLAAAATNGFS